jgi:hypothetical protein
VVSTVEMLQAFGALRRADETDADGWYQLQGLGLIGRDIRFENELWLAMILENPALEVWSVHLVLCEPGSASCCMR